MNDLFLIQLQMSIVVSQGIMEVYLLQMG